MSGHVLLHLLKTSWGKEINALDSIYHIILKSYFCVKTLWFCHMRDVKSVIL